MSGYDDRYDNLPDPPSYAKKKVSTYATYAKTTDVDPINEAVREKIKSRAKLGMEKYGVSILRDDIDLIGWLKHLQEELMDATVYVERAMYELRKRQDADKAINKDESKETTQLPLFVDIRDKLDIRA